MAPTNCRAESRGNCVSVSSVMTYLILFKTSVLPIIMRKHIFRASAQARNSDLTVFLFFVHNPSISDLLDSIFGDDGKEKMYR